MDRSLTSVISQVNICIIVQQDLGDVSAALLGGQVERCPVWNIQCYTVSNHLVHTVMYLDNVCHNVLHDE